MLYKEYPIYRVAFALVRQIGTRDFYLLLATRTSRVGRNMIVGKLTRIRDYEND